MADKVRVDPLTIVEILKKSGPLPGDALKERVLAVLNISDAQYPKSTYQDHLVKLEEHKKLIKYKIENGLRIYFIPKFEHPIPGGIFLENLDGRIYAPTVLSDSGIHITQEIPLSLDKSLVTLIFQFNSKTFCLKIPKSLLPFNIHLSRKSFSQDIYPSVNKNFEARTITLELPIINLSKYQLLSQSEDNKTGHVLLAFKENNISIEDLGATNPSEIAHIKDLTIDTFLNEISLFSDLTIDARFENRSSNITGKKKLEPGKSQQLKLPTLILLANHAQLAIF